ncbi:type II secretion system protein GspD, partial [Elusimicrobiota bacterium]
ETPLVKKKLVPKTVFIPEDSGLVDINFSEASIDEVIKGFNQKIGHNIIFAKGVKGDVSLKLKQVPFDEVFKMILDKLDLIAVVVSDHIIEIINKSDIPTERRNYSLKKRNASEIGSTLSSLLTPDELSSTNIVIDAGTNSIMLSAPLNIMDKIETIIKQLDVKTPQIMIKARLIEVSANDTKTSNVTWANTVNLSGAVSTIRPIKDMANYAIDSTAGTLDTDDAISNFTSGGAIDISAVIDNSTLYGILNILNTSNETKTISEPTILTENNQIATIHVGRNLPVLKTEVTASGTTQSVEFITEGVDLSVTPLVSSGSELVTLQVDIAVSELSGFSANNPITSERSAQTLVTVKSGNTIIIGGLIKERAVVDKSGIPVLKDIPLIGYLFRNTTNTKERTELLIFLTPDILID